MKKTSLSVFAIAATCTFFVSCNNESLAPADNDGKNFVITASFDDDATKVSLTPDGNNLKPAWAVDDKLVGYCGDNQVVYKVKSVNEGIASLEWVSGTTATGQSLSLVYVPGATDASSIVDGKINLDLSALSTDPSTIKAAMFAQATLSENTLLSFANKMAIVSINSISGVSGTIEKVALSGTKLYASATIDAKTGAVAGVSCGNVTYSGNPGSSKLYAAVVPATTTVDITVKDGSSFYQVQKGNKTFAAGSYKFVSEAAVSTMKVFSVSSSKQVVFAPGNLRYYAQTQTWSFAESQKAVLLGSNNASTVIDLFAYSFASDNKGGINVPGNSTNHSGNSAFYDWGNYAIGDYAPNYWHTLSRDEFNYLIYNHSNKVIDNALIIAYDGFANFDTYTTVDACIGAGCLVLPACGLRQSGGVVATEQALYATSTYAGIAGGAERFWQIAGAHINSSGDSNPYVDHKYNWNGGSGDGIGVRLAHEL